jgi:DNA-binding FadR family transcriptional regulator
VRHRRILKPLRNRDAEGAATAMREHLLEAGRWLQEGTEA